MDTFEYTHEGNLKTGDFCDACTAIPWVKMFEELYHDYRDQHRDERATFVSCAYDDLAHSTSYPLHEEWRGSKVWQDPRNSSQCPLCYMLLEDLGPSLDSYTICLSSKRGHLFKCGPSPGSAGELADKPVAIIVIRLGDVVMNGWKISLRDDCDFTQWAANRMTPSLLYSPRNFATMHRWMGECENSHAECKYVQALNGPFPTRLLRIGTDPGVSRSLVDTASLPKYPKYVALSHCWGKEQKVILTSKTIESFKSGLKIQDLALTFQDAISLCIQLGFSYIWIDSLCIIQDNFEDWESESSIMGVIYQRAELTIVASRARGDSQGFLGKPCLGGSEVHNMIDSEQRWHNDFEHRSYSCEPITAFIIDHGTIGAEDIVFPSASSERGWIVQELYLSRRILCFTDAGIYWACHSLTDTDSGNGRAFDGKVSLRQGRGNASGSKQLRSKHLYLEESLRISKSLSDFYRWYDMVEQDSKCELTIASDRLPALSGMAMEFSRHSKEMYYAGIWEHSIIEGLQWTSSNKGSKKPSRDCTIAPSWSWASMHAQIIFEVHEYILATVRDIKVTARGSNPYGQVKDGILRFGAPYLQIERCTWWKDTKRPNTIELRVFDGIMQAILRLDIRQEVFEEETLRCAVLSCTLRREGSDVSGFGSGAVAIPNLTALILAPGKNKTYKRVGIVSTVDARWSRVPPESSNISRTAIFDFFHTSFQHEEFLIV